MTEPKYLHYLRLMRSQHTFITILVNQYNQSFGTLN